MGEARRRRREVLKSGGELKVAPKFQVREVKLFMPRALYDVLVNRYESVPTHPDLSLHNFMLERLLDGIALFDAKVAKAQTADNLVQLASPQQQARALARKQVVR